MLEVVFSDSAAGSLSVAMGGGRHVGGAVSVSILRSDGRKPTKAKLKKAQREAEEQERRNWTQAIPLEGSRRDVLAFSLALSVGDIQEEGIGPKREAAVSQLMGTYPDMGKKAAERLLETSRSSLSVLRERVGRGEPLRIWASGNPDEACGLCWIMEQLRAFGFDNLEITIVTLPDFEERSGSIAVQYTGWGEVEPHQWGKLADHGKKLSSAVARVLADQWRELQAENAPLRAVLNGRLVSVPESLYDFVILRELDHERVYGSAGCGQSAGKIPPWHRRCLGGFTHRAVCSGRAVGACYTAGSGRTGLPPHPAQIRGVTAAQDAPEVCTAL